MNRTGRMLLGPRHWSILNPTPVRTQKQGAYVPFYLHRDYANESFLVCRLATYFMVFYRHTSCLCDKNQSDNPLSQSTSISSDSLNSRHSSSLTTTLNSLLASTTEKSPVSFSIRAVKSSRILTISFVQIGGPTNNNMSGLFHPLSKHFPRLI